MEQVVPSVVPEPQTVDLSLEGPGRQRRLTVAFRIILAIPHLLWVWLLVLVAELAIVIGWVCAVFTGRLPVGIGEFVAKVLRYYVRVVAYGGYLLTDRYPPFALDATDYAVEVQLPPPGRLNRAAVLFRIVLLVPAMIVATLVSAGAALAMIFIWLIVLVAGRLPRTIFEALTAVLRYQARLWAFAAMLTSEYPKRLFGDPAMPADASPIEAPLTDVPPLEPLPPSGPPRITRLVLSKPGKRLTVLFLVVGALGYGGTTTAAAILSAQSSTARHDFERYDREAGTASLQYARDVQGCALNGGIECLQKADVRLADVVAEFRDHLQAIDMPARAVGVAHDLDSDLGDMEDLLRELATINDPARYQSEFARLQEIGTRVGKDEVDLDALLVRFA